MAARASDVQPIDKTLCLIVSNAASTDGSIARLMLSLFASGKSTDTIVQLDIKPPEIIKLQLKKLSEMGHSVILVGHVGEHTMGGHNMTELAELLTSRGFPTNTKHPIPILALGCAPEKMAQNGSMENIGAELLIALAKKGVHATVFSINPSAVQYRMPNGNVANEWLTTLLSFAMSPSKKICWTFSGIPTCYIREYKSIDRQIDDCRQQLMHAKRQLDVAGIEYQQSARSLGELSEQRQQIDKQLRDLDTSLSKLYPESVKLRAKLDQLEKGYASSEPSVTKAPSSSSALALSLLAQAPDRSQSHIALQNPQAINTRLTEMEAIRKTMNEQKALLQEQLKKIEEQIPVAMNTMQDKQKQHKTINDLIEMLGNRILVCEKQIKQMYLKMIQTEDPRELATVCYKISTDLPKLANEDTLKDSLCSGSAYSDHSSLEVVNLKRVTVDAPALAADTGYKPPEIPEHKTPQN